MNNSDDFFFFLKEVETVLNSLGYYPSKNWLEETMKSFDEDGNDEIDFEEFCAMYEYLNKKNIENPKLVLQDSCK